MENQCSAADARCEKNHGPLVWCSFPAFAGTAVAVAALFSAHSPAHAAEKITYQDNILPLIEANCSKCHNEDKKKADLDLTSYQGALKGSGSGPVLLSGNPDGSKLLKALSHSEEPYMPPNRPRLADKDLDTVRKWIAGGLLENAGGKAVAAAGPALDFSLKPEDLGKPEGPPPMPKNFPLAQPVHTTHLSPVIGLAASPWAPLVAIAGQKQVLLYNTDTMALAGILPFNEGQPAEVRFSRNGKILLASGGRGARSGRVLLWEVETGKQIASIGGELDTILSADIRPDQSQVAFGGPGRLLKLVSTKTGETLFKIKKHTDWVMAVAYSPNGQMVASADRNGGISIWDPENGQELFTLAGHKSAVTSLSWRGDSKLLASASEDGKVKLWEMKEGKQAKTWVAHSTGILDMNYSNDGKLVTCGRDNAVIIWDGSGSKVRKMDGSEELPLRTVFTSDGEHVIASDFSGHVTAWTIKDGKQSGQLDANPSEPPKQMAASAATSATASLKPDASR